MSEFDKQRWITLNDKIYEIKDSKDPHKQQLLKELVYERNHLYCIFHSQKSSSNLISDSPVNLP